MQVRPDVGQLTETFTALRGKLDAMKVCARAYVCACVCVCVRVPARAGFAGGSHGAQAAASPKPRPVKARPF